MTNSYTLHIFSMFPAHEMSILLAQQFHNEPLDSRVQHMNAANALSLFFLLISAANAQYCSCRPCMVHRRENKHTILPGNIVHIFSHVPPKASLLLTSSYYLYSYKIHIMLIMNYPTSDASVWYHIYHLHLPFLIKGDFNPDRGNTLPDIPPLRHNSVKHNSIKYG